MKVSDDDCCKVCPFEPTCAAVEAEGLDPFYMTRVLHTERLREEQS